MSAQGKKEFATSNLEQAVDRLEINSSVTQLESFDLKRAIKLTKRATEELKELERQLDGDEE